jgi:FtsP/CotA-like multicopper oxidase with cupredoxin domain
MNRRDFLAASGSAALAGRFAGLTDVRVKRGTLAPPEPHVRADHTLTIAPLKLELAPGKVVRTIAYNGAVPGPLLRMKQGAPVTVDVVNDSDNDEYVHWHGLHIPADVDGAMEEGTPAIPAHGRRSYTFTPDPAGTRWYHSHQFAGKNFNRSTYTGQFGFLMVDPPDDPGRFDQEIFLALHDWDGYITGGDDGFEMVGYRYASINGRLLGAAEPVRVREGQRVLLRVLNASASEAHALALPGHSFTVQALDGNPVPTPSPVQMLLLNPGERIDAVVEMNAPGVWILGAVDDRARASGLGVVVEYAGRSGAPQWAAPVNPRWDYRIFERRDARPPADDAGIARIPVAIRSVFRGHGDFEYWSINGKVYPKSDPVPLALGSRYRLMIDNPSTEDHPIHLHRHTVELTKIGGVFTRGIFKDVATVPAKSTAELDFTASSAGKSLFHCHLQDHMDAGFMMLFECR